MPRAATLPVILALLFTVGAGSGHAHAGGTFSSTINLVPFNPQQACKFTPFTLKAPIGPMKAGSHVLVAQCGPVQGAAASYGWNWYLQVGKNGKTTGLAGEYGSLVLKQPGGVNAQILTTGLQKPVGAQTSAHAKGLTTGTWKATGGKTGSGTYTFTTERTGSTFNVAQLKVKGTLS